MRPPPPYAFLQLGTRWVNMAHVTDVEDHGDSVVLYLSSEMARLAGRGDQAVPLDVSRRIVVDDEPQMEKLRRWLKLNDVE